MKDLTTFISFLSSSVYNIANSSLEYWISNSSNLTHFTHTLDRIAHDASLIGDPDLWEYCYYRLFNNLFYLTQSLYPTQSDIYYHAAEIARADGTIRSRMPFKRPLYGSIGPGAHVSPAQSLIRSRFKSAIDKFSTITQTDREAIYDRSLDPAQWYFNFFMSEEFALIKRVFSTNSVFFTDWQHYLTFSTTWEPSRTLVLYPPFTYDFDALSTLPFPIKAAFITCGTTFQISVRNPASSATIYVPITLVEFY